VKATIAALMLAVGTASAGVANAQPGRRPGLEAGVRVKTAGSIRFDDAPANLTTADGRPFALFTLSNSLSLEVGIEGHVSVPLNGALRVEGAVSVARPTLRSRISGDAEGADSVTVSDRLTRLSAEAALVVLIHPGSKHVWFVRAGGGSTRGLTSDGGLLAKGTVATVGAGVKYWLRGGAHQRGGLGVDAEGRAVARWQGLALDTGRLHVVPAAVAGLFFGF